MALKKAVKDRLVTDTKKAIARAGELHLRIAVRGCFKTGDEYSPLLNPDRRDAAAFIFFEVAAQYETFCREALMIEVRKKFGVTPMRGENIMGSSDRGLAGVMGWAAPDVLQTRAKNLFGKVGFFGRFRLILGHARYDTLINAHKVRNRIAHGTGRAVTDYNKILGTLGVPIGSRKGLSVGRLLMDYPSNATRGDRWFSRFLAAYLYVVEQFDRRVIV